MTTSQPQSKTAWTIDPMHSEMGFNVRHMMISTVSGSFQKFDAKVFANEEDFSDAQVEVMINTESISTNNSDRDTHLKSDDFFNAEKFPTITFKSSHFDGETLKGELTIRDITKEVELKAEYLGTAEDPYGQTKAGFELNGEINRKDFNLSWNAVTEAGNIVVSDKVKLSINAQFVKQA